MGKKLTTHESEPGKGYAEVHFNFREEMAYVKYFDNNSKQFFTEEFPGKTVRYAQDAADNWAAGIKKLHNIQCDIKDTNSLLLKKSELFYIILQNNCVQTYLVMV